jgi:hypothetical protein
VNQYTRTQITSDLVDHKWPSTNNKGDLVWSQKDNAGFSQVFMQGPSLSTIHCLIASNGICQVTSDAHNHERPVISDNGTIAWFQDGTGGGLGYAIERLDPATTTPGFVEYSNRNVNCPFTVDPIFGTIIPTGPCVYQEHAGGKTFGISSDSRTISFYTFTDTSNPPPFRRFNVTGIGRLPNDSSPDDFYGFESPDINKDSVIVFADGFPSSSKNIYLATAIDPLSTTVIDQGQYPHISDGPNPEVTYVQNNLNVTHWPGASPSKWVALGFWTDIVGTGSAATIVYECRVNGLSQICKAQPATTGTILVTTNLQAASFTVSGPAAFSGSGTSFSQYNASPGTYTITYAAVPGYSTPPSQSKMLTGGSTIAFTGNYQGGSVNVTTNLPTATFAITGSASFSGSGTSFSQPNAPAGTYTVAFGDVVGYNTPPPQTQTLPAAGSITFNGAYTPNAVLAICNQGPCAFPSVLSPSVVSPNRLDHSSPPASCRAIKPNSAPPSLPLTVGCFDLKTHQLVPNCGVQLSLQSVPYSGGHNHNVNRPVGSFSSASTVTIISGDTGSAGLDFTLFPPEVSGDVTIQASGTLPDGSTIPSSTATITVKVNGLEALAALPTYNLVGKTTAHLDNHFGVPSMNSALISIAKQYASTYPGAVLSYNDMSLVKGGVFDLNQDWTPPHCGHSSLGAGANNVDLDLISHGVVLVPLDRWAQLRLWIIQNSGRNPYPETSTDANGKLSVHWHLTF